MKKFVLTLALFLVCTSTQSATSPNYFHQSIEQQLTQAIKQDDAGHVAFCLRELHKNPNFYLPNGETLLVWAIKNDAKVTIENVLLKNIQLKVNAPTQKGETPLMLAAIKGNIDLAKALLEKGATVNAPSTHGWTALHYSASTGQTEMTRFLIKQGALVNVRAKQGVTPLYLAARISAAKTVEVLLEAGADKTLCNDQGISPEAIAKKRGAIELSQKLAIKTCQPPLP